MLKTLSLGIATLAIAFAAAAGTAEAGDVKKGKKVFKKCKACHDMKPGKNKVGPSLHGVVGRAAGAVEKFKYSKAMKASGLTWDKATITAYLKDPKGFVPKNKMAFKGLKKDADIENVIAYIEDKSK